MSDYEKINKIVVIASSTGGPKSLQSVITKLPKTLDATVIIVQHMPSGFTNSLATRLNELSEIDVKEVVDGEELQRGKVYLAKGGKHCKVVQKHGRCYVALTDESPREGVKPCANYTFESLSGVSLDMIVAVVMTGMGADGTVGIQNLKRIQDVYTITQNQQSCIIYGMPKMVVQAGLSDKSVSLDEIADEIIKKVGVQ